MRRARWLAVLLVASVGVNGLLAWRFADERRQHALQLASIDEVAVLRTEGGLLQVSTIRSPESFQATQPHDLLGIDLGATVSRIRVPATFHYHVPLQREWPVTVRRDGTVIVIAPTVQPTLPVAIDTARLEKYAEGTWSFFTGAAELDALQRTITQTLAMKAASPSYLAFQREAARETVSEFVRQWLLTQERWSHTRGKPVQVFFADEPIGRLPAPLSAPGAGT